MTALKVILLKDTVRDFPQTDDVIQLRRTDVSLKDGAFLKHLFRYKEATLAVHRAEVSSRPLASALLLRVISRGRCFVVDDEDRQHRITFSQLMKLGWKFGRDIVQKRSFLRRFEHEVETLLQTPIVSRKLDLSGIPIYLRTDLTFGLKSGGSIGHIAGVLNNLDQFVNVPLFLTTDFIPTVRDDIPTQEIIPNTDFLDFAELPTMAFNDRFEQAARQAIGDQKVAFFYQRYSINNYCGARLANDYRVPFVLEYNGSEIWASRYWGSGVMRYESLTERAELLSLNAADVIVVVSEPLKDKLIERGIDGEKVLINPNGVNPDRYSPDIDGSEIRVKYDLDGKIVLGFIGTFGAWHGAEVLAEAYGQFLERYPEYRETVRLLMIGDGIKMGEVKAALERHHVGEACILTGLVPQTEGAKYLAACDILMSPHVPNPDGTRFFGSPTKLFEYMAMGKGIVASDLDQIGEILEHDVTAWMVEPANIEQLIDGMKCLIDDPERRERLGKAARVEVVANYTWREHTRKIVEKLKTHYNA